jgi:hypothetical protein
MRANGKGPRRRTFSVRRVKGLSTYDVHEIAKQCGVHRGTVRNWLKHGLKTLDGSRPMLVHGTELKRFLDEKRISRRQKCAVGEFYCFRCRLPRKPWGEMADGAVHTDKIAKLSALCSVCETPMHRMVRRADLPKFAALVEIRALGVERLSDWASPSENSDSRKEYPDAQAESSE